MRRSLIPILLLAVVGCSTPSTAPVSGRKVTFQPPFLAPKPQPGTSFPVKTVVGLVIDREGIVASVVPIEGQGHYLATTTDYGRQWRFTKDLPSAPSSPVILTVTYQASSMTIDIKP